QPQCQCGALVRSLPVTRLARPNFSPSSITRMSSSLSLLPTLLAAVIVGTDRRIVRRLRELNALSPEEATALPTWRLLSRWRARRLMGRGALVPVPPDRVYLNEEAWRAYRMSRRRRILIVLAILIPFVVYPMWLSRR